jgi:subtilisin-like proprotein convertase family protein/uncharacterized protein YvpB
MEKTMPSIHPRITLILVMFAMSAAAFAIVDLTPASASSASFQAEITPLSPTLSQPDSQSTTSQILSATQNVTPTLQTETPVSEATPTATPTPPPGVNLPFVMWMPTPTPPPPPPEKLYFCNNPYVNIPDKNLTGVNDSIVLNDLRTILDINVRLDIGHSYVGDLDISLTHQESGNSLKLIDRPGAPASAGGCSKDNIGTILDDEITLPVENQCSDSPAAIAGIFTPDQFLSSFDGELADGTWTLNVVDRGTGDTGTLKTWCMAVTLGDVSQLPTPPPPPPELPSQARIYNISGQPQAMPLDCESRVAVDWAAYFGVYINEYEFFNNLPHSDNPDSGFVGDVWGVWGQIPPYAYGVHAEPVAALLRAYGVNAYAHRPLSWDDLRAEIAAGRPVYVWTISSAAYNEIPIYYTARDGHTSIVAHYEHTVMVIGYDENSVTIMDGGKVIKRTRKGFLSSWSALGNMAITALPAQ